MSAKSELMTRLQYLGGAISLPELIDHGIAQSDHNGIANLLRKGLGIVSFNILEDFIKQKAVEALDEISSCGIAFSDLPENLQSAAIFDAFSAIQARLEMIRKVETLPDRMIFAQVEAGKISSTSNFPFQLSGYSFVSKGSNVSLNEVSDMVSAFGIKGGWAILKEISDKIGGGIPDLGQAYQNASLKRNRAAHAAAFVYDYTSLSGFKNEILAIAASIDILLSARCRQVRNKPKIKMDIHDIGKGLNFRFLEPRGNIFIETKSIGGNVVKKWTTLQDGISFIQPNLFRKSEFLIVLNASKRIENWYT